MTELRSRDCLALLETFAPTRPVHGWVRFCRRQMIDAGFRVEVLRYGDRDRGAVAVKLRDAEGNLTVLVRVVRSANGEGLWMPIHSGEPGDGAATGAKLDRLAALDPDIWILKIEVDQPLRQQR